MKAKRVRFQDGRVCWISEIPTEELRYQLELLADTMIYPDQKRATKLVDGIIEELALREIIANTPLKKALDEET